MLLFSFMINNNNDKKKKSKRFIFRRNHVTGYHERRSAMRLGRQSSRKYSGCERNCLSSHGKTTCSHQLLGSDLSDAQYCTGYPFFTALISTEPVTKRSGQCCKREREGGRTIPRERERERKREMMILYYSRTKI